MKKLVLILLLLLIPLFVLATQIVGHTTLETGLSAYYDLEETSGTRVDGTTTWDLTDFNTVLNGTGIINNSAAFVAANSEWLGTATDFADWGADSISINIWLKSSTDNPFSIVIGVNDGGTATTMIWNGGTSYAFLVRKSGSNGISPSIAEATLQDGAWHMITGTYDGSDVRLYHDGTEISTGTSFTGNIDTSFPDKLSLGAGAGSGTPGSFWDGETDQVGVWDKGLTSTEVTALYASGAALIYQGAASGWEDSTIISKI